MTALFGGHIFDRVCDQHGIKHRLTRPNHPWTTDEVEQSLFARTMLFCSCPRVTARRRAGLEVRSRPRRLHSRSSFAAPVGTRMPRRLQPSVMRR
jgi:hypothetical protein